MSRQIKDWIVSYIKYMEDTEHPTAYHIWNAIGCIAGTLQRRVYMPWGGQTIYPNMYIVLVGGSGLGKGESMKPVIEMFKETGLAVAPDAVTTASLIVNMRDKQDQYVDENNNFVTHSSMMIFAKELVVLLGQRDVQKIAYLTDWYDGGDWENSTKTQGEHDLYNVCLTLLGASAPDWFSSMLPLEAMGGGFTSRIIFIVETEKAKTQPIPIYTNKHVVLRQMLTERLHDIRNVVGAFTFTKDAKKLYSEFYIKQELDIQKDIWPVQDSTFAGYTNRRKVHLCKMSMIFAVSRGSKGIVTAQDFDKSLLVLRNAETKMPRLFGGVGRSVHGPIINAVMDYLLKYRKSTRSKILRIFYKDLDVGNIDIVEGTLIKMGLLELTKIAGNRDVGYKIRDDWED